MNRQEQFQKHKEYVKFNELDKLINFQENIEYNHLLFWNLVWVIQRLLSLML